MLSLVWVALSIAPPKANAMVEVPTLRFGIGMVPISFTAGTVASEATSLGNKLTLNPMFLWDLPGLRSRLGFHFLTDLGSDYGFISTAGIGISYIYYPTGLSSARELRDDGSSIVATKISPFIQVSITPTKFSVTIKPDDPTKPSSSWDYFSSSVIETSVGAGVDYPFNENLIGFAGLHYRWAAYTKDETTKGPLHYSGIGLILGVMTSFY